MTSKRWFSCTATLLGVLACAAPARALGWVLPEAGHESTVTAIRAAAALTPEQTTVWSDYAFDGAPGRVAVVLPLSAGTALDATASAASWLDALDSATTVRVLPPAQPLCGIDARAIDVVRSAAGPWVEPDEVAQLSSLAELQSFAASHGFGFDARAESALGVTNGPFVALVYSLPDGLARTGTLRETTPLQSVDRVLEPLDRARSISLTLFILDVTRTALRGFDELGAADLATHWLAQPSRSDYAQRRADALDAGSGSRTVVEAAGPAPLFDAQPVRDPIPPIRAAVQSYVDLGLDSGSISDADACLQKVTAARASAAPLARACAAGALAKIPSPSGTGCVESWQSGELPPDLVRCDAADDLALAFSGRRLDAMAVTRTTSLLGPRTPASIALDPVTSDAVSPVVFSVALDGAACTSGGDGTGVDLGSPGSGTAGGDGTSTVVVVQDPGQGYAPTLDQPAESCTCGTSSSGSDGCSSDTSSSSSEDCSGSTDSSGDGCSSDSSSSSSDGCSSDSSSGSGCSNDTSGSDSSGTDCSGSTDSGGDGCSANGESGGCSVSGRRQPRFSVLTLVMAVVVLPIRRATSRRRGPDGKKGRKNLAQSS